MAQIRCPNGHFYNNELYDKCPYCKTVPLDPPSDSKMPWLVTGVAALIAVFCFVQTGNAQKELDQINRSLSETHQQLDDATDKLSEVSKRIDDKNESADIAGKIINLFRATYGHGSDSFYADTPMVILKAGGEARKFTVYFNPNGKGGTVQPVTIDRAIDARCLSKWCSDISCQWSSEAWSDHKKDFFVTPGKTRGYNIIHFMNDADNNSFDVLIIVK